MAEPKHSGCRCCGSKDEAVLTSRLVQLDGDEVPRSSALCSRCAEEVGRAAS